MPLWGTTYPSGTEGIIMDEETKAAIEAAVAEATDKLKSKNSELIKEVRDLKAGKATAEDEADNAKADAERKAGDITALEARLTAKFDKERDAITAERDTAMVQMKALMIDNVIANALVDNNVQKFAVDPLTAMFKAGATLDDGVATLGGKPLTDALKTYFDSEAGQHYVAAPNNTGTGASGATATTGGDWANLSSNPAEWTAKQQSELATLANQQPAQYNAVVAQKGLPDSFKV